MPKHTPGPVVKVQFFDADGYVVKEATGKAVAKYKAAPDLLDVARLLDRAFTKWSNDSSDRYTLSEWIERVGLDELTVRAALRKARGEATAEL